MKEGRRRGFWPGLSLCGLCEGSLRVSPVPVWAHGREKSAALQGRGPERPLPQAARFLSCDGLYPPAIRAFEEVLTHGKEGEGRPLKIASSNVSGIYSLF